jgi:hypothetical protein
MLDESSNTSSMRSLEQNLALEKQNQEINHLQQNLSNLEKEAEGIYNAAALSSRTKRFIDKNNYKQIKKFLNVQDYGLSDIEPNEEHPSDPTGVVSFLDPKTNKYFDIPANQAELAESENPNWIRQ